MKVICFDVSREVAQLFNDANQHKFSFKFTNAKLNTNTVGMCDDFDCVVLTTTNYQIDENVEVQLNKLGVRLIVCSHNASQNLDILSLAKHQITVANAVYPYDFNDGLIVLNSMLYFLTTSSEYDAININQAANEIYSHKPETLAKRIGLVGYGAFGQLLAAMLISLGFQKISYYDPKPLLDNDVVVYTDWNDLIVNCDLISFQMNYTSHLKMPFINKHFLNALNPNTKIINNMFSKAHDLDAVKEWLANPNQKAQYCCNFTSSDSHEFAALVALNLPNLKINVTHEFLSKDKLRFFIDSVISIVYEFGTTARTKSIID